jgi:hypothetical protein
MNPEGEGNDRMVTDSTGAGGAPDGPQDNLEKPRCAYFYYVSEGKGDARHPHAAVEAYLMQEDGIGPRDKIEDLIPVWAQRAKDRRMRPVGWALGDLRWRRKSFLVVVLDASSARFDSAEGLVIGEGADSFREKTLVDFATSDGSRMQAIYCLNLMRKKGGGGWDPDKIEHDKYYPLRLELTSKSGAERPIITHDDVGTNTGPPREDDDGGNHQVREQ